MNFSSFNFNLPFGKKKDEKAGLLFEEDEEDSPPLKPTKNHQLNNELNLESGKYERPVKKKLIQQIQLDNKLPEKEESSFGDLLGDFEFNSTQPTNSIYGDFQSSQPITKTSIFDDFQPSQSNSKNISTSNYNDFQSKTSTSKKVDNLFDEFECSSTPPIQPSSLYGEFQSCSNTLFDEFQTSSTSNQPSIYGEFHSSFVKQPSNSKFDDFSTQVKPSNSINQTEDDQFGEFLSVTANETVNLFNGFKEFDDDNNNEINKKEEKEKEEFGDFLSSNPIKSLNSSNKELIYQEPNKIINSNDINNNNKVDEFTLLDQSLFIDTKSIENKLIKSQLRDSIDQPLTKTRGPAKPLRTLSHYDVDQWFGLTEYILLQLTSAIDIINKLDQFATQSDRKLLNQFDKLKDFIKGISELIGVMDRLRYSVKLRKFESTLPPLNSTIQAKFVILCNGAMRLAIPMPQPDLELSDQTDFYYCSICLSPLPLTYKFKQHVTCKKLMDHISSVKKKPTDNHSLKTMDWVKDGTLI